MSPFIIDLCGGPGGWSEGLRRLGIAEDVGLDISLDACATARAAGHPRTRADIALIDPTSFVGDRPVIVIGSPPCWAWSTGGLKTARSDQAHVMAVLDNLAGGLDTRATAAPLCQDPTSMLVVEPLRYVLTTGADTVILEQVPAVIEVWEKVASILRPRGYNVWAGVLEAADYGVPQTRKRAILIASRSRKVAPPEPTHAKGTGLLYEPWSSMGEAAGWDGEWMVGFPRRNDRGDGLAFRARDRRSSTLPAFTITEKARSWTRVRVDGSDETRITLEEAALFQSFRADYPFAGSRTSQFLQCADAVPPRFAEAVLRAALPTLVIDPELAASSG